MSTLAVRFGAAVLVTLTLQARVPQPAADLAIEHVAVIDGIHNTVLSDQTVVTANGRIVSVGPSAAAAVPASSFRVEGRAASLSFPASGTCTCTSRRPPTSRARC